MTSPPPITRLERALALSVEHWPDGRWLVTGGTMPHVVDAAVGCDCFDAKIRGGDDCKHVLAIRLQRGDPALLHELAVLVAQLRGAQRPSHEHQRHHAR